MLTSVGTLRHSIENGQYKLIVEVDPAISDYARALVPKFVRLQRQRYAPHITVVRNEQPDPLRWGVDEGRLIQFEYEPHVYSDDRYYWLNVHSRSLRVVRLCLGLPVSSEWSRPPDGQECFHLTIGNTKR